MSAIERRLRYFVAVAQAGSLGRAATQLHLAQPALTRHIRLLEDEVGAALFERTARGMRLTSAGQVYLPAAQQLLADMQAAAQAARLAATGRLGHLRLGFSEIYAWHPEVLRALRDSRRAEPGVTFTIEAQLSGGVVQRLRDGHLDMAVAYPGPATLPAPLDSRRWMTDEYRLAVSAGSPLARRPPRRLRDLAEEDFVLFRRDQSPPMYDLILHHFHQRGFSPRIVQEGTSHTTVLALVAAGLGCSVIPQSAQSRIPAGVRLVEVGDMDLRTPIHLIWRTDRPSELIDRFARRLCPPPPSG